LNPPMSLRMFVENWRNARKWIREDKNPIGYVSLLQCTRKDFGSVIWLGISKEIARKRKWDKSRKK